MTIQFYLQHRISIPVSDQTRQIDKLYSEIQKRLRRNPDPTPKIAQEIEQMWTSLNYKLDKLEKKLKKNDSFPQFL